MNDNNCISLVVLAAGMGSRYGGLKQLDTFGPHGESIIDYSIYDAVNAGFDKVVFIVRESFQDTFKEIFDPKLDGLVKVEYINQELYQLPKNYEHPEDRQKPWGTGHAMLVAREAIEGPFCIINGDDFYGREAFVQMYNFLCDPKNNSQNIYSVVGYLIANTLSDHGSVSRGVCHANRDGYLSSIVETHKIRMVESGDIMSDKEGKEVILNNDSIVSMNMWGAFPSIMDYTENYFKKFLDINMLIPKSEFYIPLVMDNMIKHEEAKIKILNSEAKWFGVTYKEDKEEVRNRLQELIDKKIYPAALWDN